MKSGVCGVFMAFSRWTQRPVKEAVRKMMSAWWGIFLMMIRRVMYARIVPHIPKLSIPEPMAAVPVMSEAKPIEKEVMIESLVFEKTAKKTISISSRSGFILRLVRERTLTSPAWRMAVTSTSRANLIQRILSPFYFWGFGIITFT
jgi:hypothetical protein